jgi:hypoxanthine phosphoribosyltransferase
MKLDYNDIKGNLLTVSRQISEEGSTPDMVAYIGSIPKEIGEFFADYFGCDICHLPSLHRKKRKKTLAKIVNRIYPLLPENVLRVITEKYKQIYASSERDSPEVFEVDSKLRDKFSVLLIDDNALTGKTLEAWKKRLKDRDEKDVQTFSVAVSGEYKPDFYCFDKWHSFKWRPIGI